MALSANSEPDGPIPYIPYNPRCRPQCGQTVQPGAIPSFVNSDTSQLFDSVGTIARNVNRVIIVRHGKSPSCVRTVTIATPILVSIGPPIGKTVRDYVIPTPVIALSRCIGLVFGMHTRIGVTVIVPIIGLFGKLGEFHAMPFFGSGVTNRISPIIGTTGIVPIVGIIRH